MEKNLGSFQGGQLHVRVNGPVKDGGEVFSYDLDKFTEKQIDAIGDIFTDIDRHIDVDKFFGWVSKGYVMNGND